MWLQSSTQKDASTDSLRFYPQHNDNDNGNRSNQSRYARSFYAINRNTFTKQPISETKYNTEHLFLLCKITMGYFQGKILIFGLEVLCYLLRQESMPCFYVS